MFATCYIPRSLGVLIRDLVLSLCQLTLSYKDWPISKISMGESGTTSTSQGPPPPLMKAGGYLLSKCRRKTN